LRHYIIQLLTICRRLAELVPMIYCALVPRHLNLTYEEGFRHALIEHTISDVNKARPLKVKAKTKAKSKAKAIP